MVRILGSPLSTVVCRPAFPFPDSPSSAVSSRQSSWTVRDEVVRRFLEPASDAERSKTERHIRSAVAAYNDAVAGLKGALRAEDVAGILSPSASTVAELHRVALGIQDEQASALDRRTMARLVDVLDHYSSVFDVLSQCGLSYLTLLWGSLKFALIMAKGHYNMLPRFADMLIEIGFNLPRVELYRYMFPTSRMLETVSELYAAIIEFLREMITYTSKRSYRKFFGSVLKPFDLQYGRLVERIRRLHQCVQDDAQAGTLVRQCVQMKSLQRHRVDLSLRRNQYEATLRDIHEGQVTPLFLEIRRTLFHGFEIEASYHEELAATFKLTSSPAWAQWLSIEQQYVPSRFSHETTIVQAECDAPDAATCLQWVAQTRAESPHVASAFVLWARGMTAQSAIASLVFQMLQQRPQALSSVGLDMPAFARANASLPRLWSLFRRLVQQLGGLMVYISIGSVGAEEFGIVQRFVDLCAEWSGPPLNVVLIHPFDDGFARVDGCVDLDEKYDVHPCLTTTDALLHVVLLELGVPADLSETVRLVLWEALWREVRYAVIGIAVKQAARDIARCARELAASSDGRGGGAGGAVALWLAAVARYTDKKNRRVVNAMREQIQRHLNLVDIHLPPEARARLERRVRAVVDGRLGGAGERAEAAAALGDGASRHLEEAQRRTVWARTKDAIRPGTMAMYNASIAPLMAEAFEAYLEDPPDSEREARTVVQGLLRGVFGWNGRWKDRFSESKEPVVEGIVASIDAGFVDVVNIVVSWYKGVQGA